MQIVTCRFYPTAARLNEDFGNRWIALNTPSRWFIDRDSGQVIKPTQPYPLSPLAEPRIRSLKTYKRWLWGKIKAGDKQIIDSLRAINDDTVFVDRSAAQSYCTAGVICKAAEWLKQNYSSI